MRDVVPIALMGGLFILVDVLALLLVTPFQALGVTVFENPNDPVDLLYFLVTFIVFTVIILLLAKYSERVVQGIVLASTAYLIFFILYPLLGFALPDLVALVLSLAVSAILLVLLVKHPEWYVVDACGILIGLGAITLLGISLNILLVIILLAALAVYDAISVYRTKHMITLADVVVDLKLPVVLVIPKIRGYSLVKDKKRLKEKLAEGEEREAFLMGLGDIVMPGILVTSTFSNISSNGLWVAISVMIGTMVGFLALMFFVLKGKPQAGLPLLCTGAILGYLVSSLILFGKPVGIVPA
jgi:presenilin-like A22 family membrane protease